MPGAERLDADGDPSLRITVPANKLRRIIGNGYLLYVGGAVLIALLGGLWAEMPWYALLGWVLFAAFAAIVHELLVGLAAMHSGWFPAFAITLIFLVIGLLMGMPMVPLTLFVAYCASTGPAFADMGYDLKAGWILRRGERPYERWELEGRKQQFISSVVGFVVAMVVVALLWRPFLESGQIPPVSKVFGDTIVKGLADPNIWVTLLLWAIPGAIIQILGGSKRQMGIMLATGLLITSLNAGWLVLAGIAARLLWRRYRKDGENEAVLFGAGVIAGDAIWGTAQVFK